MVAAVSPDTPLTRAEWVDARLRRAILTGELRADQRLRAEHLAAQWGVSATPVREAFQRLAGEGWVVIEAQRGARVSPVDRREAAELYEVRLALEPLALSAAMAAATPDSHAVIRRAHACLGRRHTDVSAFLDAHRAFHLSLFATCPNSHLVRLVAQLHDHTQRFHVASAPARRGDVAGEHDALCTAVLAGDVTTAITVLGEHLQGTLRSLAAE